MRLRAARAPRRSRMAGVPANGHRDAVGARRSAAARLVDPSGAVAARIAAAPAAYLLVHRAGDIVRHCELLTPVPSPWEVRVAVTPGGHAGEWRLDIASRDRPGLLASFSGVLAAHALDVAQAVVATWHDGAALETFVVRSAGMPDCVALEDSLQASLAGGLTSPPIPDAEVTFDDASSLTYTACQVRAEDRPGLLHAVAVAIAVAGGDVHAASVTTTGGVAHDRFDLSDRNGRKLEAAAQLAIRAAVLAGVDAVRPRR